MTEKENKNITIRISNCYKDFQCKMCGRCCRSLWIVALTEDEVRDLRQLASIDNEIANKLHIKKTSSDMWALNFLHQIRIGFLDRFRLMLSVMKEMKGEKYGAEFAFERIVNSLQNQIEISDNNSKTYQIVYDIAYKSSKCGFLEKSSTCYIHKNNGEKELPNVCRMFPRVISEGDHNKDFGLTFSCKAAVELLKTKYTTSYTKMDPDQSITSYPSFINNHMDMKSLKMEEHVLDILKGINPDFQDSTFDKRIEAVADLISNGMETQKRLGPHFTGSTNEEFQKFIIYLLEKYTKVSKIAEPEMYQLHQLFYSNQDFDFLSSNERYNEYMDCFSYILENYYIEFLFAKGSQGRNIQENFLFANVIYQILKMSIVMYSKNSAYKLSQEFILTSILAVERCIVHSHFAPQEIRNFIS